MDWIRLGNSGKDLNGIGGRIRPVTPTELTSHNTQGPEELMRGAGIDATELFDKVHPWVNYDSLLAKCLVGPLCADRPDAEELFDITNPSPKSDCLREPSKAQELVRKSMENLANCITPVRKKITTKSEENVKGSPPSKIMQSLIQSSDLPVSISRRAASSPIKCVDKTKGSPPPLRFDWIQTSTKLTISIYTGVLANPGGSARIIDGRLHVNVATNGWLRTVELIPEEVITDPIQLRVFSESGKIEVTASKARHKVWKNVGVTSFGAATQITSPRTLECRVMHSERVSHDTTLLALSPLSGPVVVPLGHHVRVHLKVNSNPRNKCALQPGHSLMDWIRLGNSGKDLNGIGGLIRPVTPTELTSHNTQGPEELMRGAGIDATELFDKVHPWVNYDSLLAKCLVGPLCADRPDAEELFDITNPSPKSDRLREPSKAQELVRKSMENLANCITPVRKKITTKSEENVKGSPPSKIMQSLIQSSDLPVSISRRAASSPIKCVDKTKGSPPPLRFDWIQTSTKLTISIYTGVLANPGGSARIIDGRLHVNVATNGWLRTVELIPEEVITDPIQLRVFSESGKIEVTASKARHKVWKNVGVTSFGAATQITSPRTLECRVMHSERVSHDTTLLALSPLSGPVVVPLGHHVRVHLKVNNKECIRSYTPVGEGWDGFGSDISALKLAVKRYETGDVSPHLTSLEIGDTISLSGPYGNFHLQKLKQVKIMYLLAAGSGITPMLGLLRFMLARSNPRCERVHLMFFNKTKDDILFKENFEEIAKQDKRLNVVHILSNASSSWTGLKGRISSEILSQIIDKDISTQEKQVFFCLCGRTEFTHAGLDLLKKLGVKKNDIHAFIG